MTSAAFIAAMSLLPTFSVKEIVGRSNSGGQILCHQSEMKETFGQTLRRLRDDRGLTQVDLAAELDMGRSTIAGYEKGHDIPGREALEKFSAYFNVSVDYLYSAEAALAPKIGERVENKDEAALLAFWRTLDDAGQRLFLLALAKDQSSR